MQFAQVASSARRRLVGLLGAVSLVAGVLTVGSGNASGLNDRVTTVTSHLTSRPCVPAQLSLTVRRSSGAAGTTYYSLRVRNEWRTNCDLSGIPMVRPLSSLGGRTVGPPATRVRMTGRGASLRVKPGKSASASLGVTSVANYPSATCHQAVARALSVGVHGGHVTGRLTFSVCTALSSVTIRGWVPLLTSRG